MSDTRDGSRWRALALGTVILTMAATGCGGPPELPPGAFLRPPPSEREIYRIDAGDILDIDFFYHPELSREIVVRPDGRITLPGIGDVEAAGETPAELARLVSETYAALLKDPLVTVSVREMASARVYVVGEVLRPGGYPLQGEASLSTALSEAGGPTRWADLDDVVIYRRVGSEEPVSYRVDASGLREGRTANPEVHLAPSDIIYVPRSSTGRLTDALQLLNQPGVYYVLLLLLRN